MGKNKYREKMMEYRKGTSLMTTIILNFLKFLRVSSTLKNGSLALKTNMGWGVGLGRSPFFILYLEGIRE